MDAARAEAHLRNLEPAAFAEQDILARDADIVEAHVHMTLRRMVGAEHAHRTEHLHAGRVHRHEDLRMLRLTRSEEHTSELQSLMRTSYAVFCLKKKNTTKMKQLYTKL